MIGIILIVPIIIYIVIMILAFDRFIKIKNKTLKSILFIFAITLPFLDHIIGYGIFKYLCKEDGGVKVFKTVTDESEQRNYWLKKGINPFGKEYKYEKLNHQYLSYTQYLSKDLSKVVNLYHDSCFLLKDKEKIKKCRIKVREYFNNNVNDNTLSRYHDFIPISSNSQIKKDIFKTMKHFRERSGREYFEESSLQVTRIANFYKEPVKVEFAYRNYCKKEYDNLGINEQNYKRSCKYAEKIIKEYKLANIIKVPKSPYTLYLYFLDRDYNSSFIDFLNITIYINKISNSETGEILAIEKLYGFKGGWYLNMISTITGAFNKVKMCPEKINYKKFQELVIPNPFRAKK